MQLVSKAKDGEPFATVGDTTFVLVGRPHVFLKGNLNGFKFKFVDADTLYFPSVRQLDDPDPANPWKALLGEQTVSAVRAIYPLDETHLKAADAGIGRPRFRKRLTIVAPQSSSGLTKLLEEASSTTVNVKGSAAFSVQISKSIGFTDQIPGIETIKTMFTAGASIQVTVTGVQERTTQTILTTGAVDLHNDADPRFTQFHWDRLWKTLLVTDEGRIVDGIRQVSGQVTDPFGTPIGGAIVGLGDGSSIYATTADSAGRYEVWSSDPLPAGSYTVYCSDATANVWLGGGGAIADLAPANVEGAGQVPDPYPDLQ